MARNQNKTAELPIAPKAEEKAVEPKATEKAGSFKWSYSKAESYTLSFDRAAIALVAESAGMKAEGFEYALGYGLEQSMSDVIAGKVAQLEGTAKAGNWSDKDRNEKAVEFGLVDKDGAPAYTVKQLGELYLAELWAERWKAILSGTITTRKVGPKLTGLAAIVRDVTEEFFLIAFAKTNAKRDKAGQKRLALPEKDAYKTALAGFYAIPSKKVEIDAESERRFAFTKVDETEDFDESLLMGTATPVAPVTPA